MLAMALLGLLAYSAAAQTPSPSPTTTPTATPTPGPSPASTPAATPTPRPTPTLTPPPREPPGEVIPGPELGTLQFDPATFLPSDPPGATPDVTGARIVGSGFIARGQKFTARFPQTGSFPYICALHGPMTGTVVVVPSSEAVPSH